VLDFHRLTILTGIVTLREETRNAYSILVVKHHWKEDCTGGFILKVTTEKELVRMFV
jgi:hypothetical protein